jgi:acetyl-CoA synthetase
MANDNTWDLSKAELEYNKDSVNIGWYCSDRHCANGKSDKIALYYEGFGGIEKKYTFNDIRLASNTIGRFLKNIGVSEGDVVCLFMDRIPELYLSFLGVLKIGSIVQPLFSAFGEESLYIRLNDAETRVIITQKKYLQRVKAATAKLPKLEYIIIIDAADCDYSNKREILFCLDKAHPEESLDIYPSTADSHSVLHYTSGTTGLPKGVEHVHSSIISQYYTTKVALDLRENDIYWCTADPGWVTGTSYGIIGPWSIGVTQCILNSGFTPQAWYQFIEKYRISVWYTAPTAIRSLMKAGGEIIKEFDLSSLRHLASVGEPLNGEAVIWSEKNFGKPFYDTFWQTETGSIMIANIPGIKIKPGSMGKPFPGITAAILDPETYIPYNEPNKAGLIAFKPDWPSLMRGYWKNKEKYNEKFKNGWYLSGDRAYIDDDGYYWFVGRDDDVINTGGHLVSPFEVESALLEHPAVAESAVIAKPDDIYMEVVKAFISLKSGFEESAELKLEIMNFIRKKLSSFAMPQEIVFTDKIPKTRSGKIMRRMLRAIEWKEDIGDTSTLED